MLPTIFASATPAGRSALSVLRIAGPEAFNIMKKLAPRRTFPHRQAKLSKLYTKDHQLLDEALVLAFNKPHSFTGEDIVELYLHGSPVVSRAVQNAIVSTNLARHAEPGEFTRRAFQNRRLDLTQVEGIRDLLAAETEMQRRSAVGGAVGKSGEQFELWRSQLVNVSAMLTASIDFAEDNGLEESVNESLRTDLLRILGEVENVLSTSGACSELVKDGLRIALLGEPNAGKSSLTNRLVQRSAALVSEIPGTTRDVLEVALEVGGHKVVLVDTAGIRVSNDHVEKLGVERAREVVNDAHLVLALFPASSPQNPEIEQEIRQLESMGKKVIRIQSKQDLISDANASQGPAQQDLKISALTGAGIDELVKMLTDAASQLVEQGNSDSNGPDFQMGMGISVRARALLSTEVVPGLQNCIGFLDNDVVLANAELQRAVEAIGAITGRVISVHEVLDVVFGEFCIGK